MFVTKKYHEAVVKGLEEQIALLQSASDYQKMVLMNQIMDLKKLVFTPTSATEIPTVAREADAVISVSEKPIARPDSDMTPEDMRQFDAILAGEYEEGLPN